MAHTTTDALTLPEIARTMLGNLIAETADPDSCLPSWLRYSMATDPDTRRIRINVYGFTDPEIYDGPDHVSGIAPDMPEILGAFAEEYGATWDLSEPAEQFHLLVSLLDESEQRRYKNFATTAIVGNIPDHELNDPRYH